MSSVSIESERVPTAGSGHYGWPAALILLALAAVASAVLLWPSVLSITHIWRNSETYQHGMVILPLALYLAWTRRADLARVAPRPSVWGLVWLAGAGLAWILARSVDVKLVQHFALVAMLPGLVLALLGIRVAWILVFPLGYLFFAVPFGDFIVPWLQDFTAWFSVLLLRLTGLPVFQDGYYISIPAGDFVVAEVCSGVRYLIASLALGLIYAYISYRSVWRRLALVALAIALPIVANGVRTYGIIMIAHWTDMQHAVGVDHLIYGWFFFGLVMVLLFWLGSLWWERPLSPSPLAGEGRPASDSTQLLNRVGWATCCPRGPGRHRVGNAALLPTLRNLRNLYPIVGQDGLSGRSPKSSSSAPVNRIYLTAMLAVLGLILAAPRAGELWLTHRAQQIAVETGPSLPGDLPGWRGPLTASGAWQPQYHDADAELAGAYRDTDTGETVELHLYHYLNRGEGTEIVSYRNRMHDGRTWRRSSESGRLITRAGGDALAVHESVLAGPGGPRVVWHWYQAGGHATTRGVVIKLREAQALLRGDGRGSLLVAVSSEAGASLDRTRSVMEDFISQLPLPVEFAGHD